MRFIFYTFLITLIGCAGTYKQKVEFNPSEPLRIAVLPFVAVDNKGKVIDLESRLVIDNISLVSSNLEENPTQIVRKQVLAELEKTNLDIISSALIDLDLPHRGFINKNGGIDTQKVWATNSFDLCTKFLNCDAILYGKVTRWDRNYYGLQTVNTVGVDLKLVGAKDGKVLFESQATDSESRGLTKGPTGFSSLVLEPIRGLDSQIVVDLSRSVVQKMIAPLAVKNRPEFLASAPPSIYAVSHDGGSIINRNRQLAIVLYGSPNQQASFSIGNVIQHIPMLEREPGHYYGEYVSIPSDKFENAEVLVYLSDKFGRETMQPIAGKNITLRPQTTNG